MDNSGDNDPASYDRCSDASKIIVQRWIELVIQPAKTENNRTSYGLKHALEYSNPRAPYLTNGEFKGAMLAAGYLPVDSSDLNCTYRIKPRARYRRDSKRHLASCPYAYRPFCLCHISQEQRAAYEQLLRSG